MYVDISEQNLLETSMVTTAGRNISRRNPVSWAYQSCMWDFSLLQILENSAEMQYLE